MNPLSRRVGCNLLWLVPDVVGGSEDYMLGLLGALADDPDFDPARVVLFVNPETLRAHPHLARTWLVDVAPVSSGHRAVRIAEESTWLAHRVRHHDLALVHHFGGLLPWYHPRPAILTIHDLQPLVLPANFSWVKQRYLRAALPASARRAERIVTLSHDARRDVHQLLGVSEERIEVIYPGRTPPVGSPSGAAMRADVRSRYDLGAHPFFVFPAITWAHKNHVLLIEAFAELARRRPDPLLVLPGGEGPAEQEVCSAIARSGHAGRIRRLGRIPRRDLDALLCDATALVFPSRFEGFGLPAIEAMGFGCPVIAASATALPEVVGAAGILVSPTRPEEWTHAMGELLDDPERRAKLIAAGRRRAGDFSWSNAARATVALWAMEAGW